MHVERVGKCLIIKIFIFSILIVFPRACSACLFLFLFVLEKKNFVCGNCLTCLTLTHIMTEMSSYKKIKI